MLRGSPSDINAYQAKLHGLHLLLVALKYFCTQQGITSGVSPSAVTIKVQSGRHNISMNMSLVVIAMQT